VVRARRGEKHRDASCAWFFRRAAIVTDIEESHQDKKVACLSGSTLRERVPSPC
jgi:hypothetical protein